MRAWLCLCLCACGSGDLLGRVNALENEEARLLAERAELVEDIELLERRAARYELRRSTRSGSTSTAREVVTIEGVEATGEDSYRVPRAALRALLEREPGELGRAIPRFEDGEPNGFRVYAIRRTSAGSSLGLRNGDVVLTVNGEPIVAPTREWAEALLEGERIELVGTRRGAPFTLVWTLHDEEAE